LSFEFYPPKIAKNGQKLIKNHQNLTSKNDQKTRFLMGKCTFFTKIAKNGQKLIKK